jgi:hypothetical protein
MPPEQDVLEKPAADEAADKAAVTDDKQTSETPAGDKSADKSVADDAGDDEGDADADKGEKAGEDKTADSGEKDAAVVAAEAAAAEKEAAWRSRVVERLLAPLADKLSAAKLEKRRTQLTEQVKRYKSVEEAVIAGLNAQEKIRSGDHLKAPDGSEEEVAAWRKSVGIPSSADDIKIPNVPGKEWGDADQPALDGFRDIAYKAQLNQDQINELVRFQVQETQRIEAEYEANLKKADKADREACQDALRTEYGIAEFKPNMAIMNRLFDDSELFGDAKAEIMSARYFNVETGTWHRLTSLPSVARAFIALATDRYGEGAMPAGDGRTTTTNRLAEIEKVMKTDYDRYVREGMADEAMKIHQAAEDRAQKRSKR